MKTFLDYKRQREKDVFIAIVGTMIVCIFIGYAICKPMGLSEATAILNERGYTISSQDEVVIGLVANPLPIELEAAAILGDEYSVIRLDQANER